MRSPPKKDGKDINTFSILGSCRTQVIFDIFCIEATSILPTSEHTVVGQLGMFGPVSLR